MKKNNKGIDKTFVIIKVVVILCFLVLAAKLMYVSLVQGEGFSSMANYQIAIETTSELPRGEIYDTNGNLIVGSKSNKSLMYVESGLMSNDEKMATAQKIAELIALDDVSINQVELTDLWLSYPENLQKVEEQITDAELLNATTSEDYNDLLRSKVKQEDLDAMIEQYGEETIAIRLQMNHATSKTPVVIEESLTTEEIYNIEQAFGTIGGFYLANDWVRYYPYGDSMRSFIGECKQIPADEIEAYEAKGYYGNEEVGISYLEKALEPVLHSKPQVIEYYFDENGNIVDSKVKDEGEAGSDAVLTIDMEMQQALEEELKIYLEKNTFAYGNEAYAVISDPYTGDIYAMAGVVEEDGEVYDNAIGNFTNAYPVGSVVKPAVLLMGYEEEVLEYGTVIYDAPMIFQGTKPKASFRNMGSIDEYGAIAMSSNVYFYTIFLWIAGYTYTEGMALDIPKETFDLVRGYFAEFGLGVSTGINVENENTGFIGGSTDPGLYIDLANGQYDTYTNLQLNQYVSTIANDGYRYRMEYLESVNEPQEEPGVGNVIYQQENVVLNELSMSKEDIHHTQDTMKGCQSYPGGSCQGHGFADVSTDFGAKTGTSEDFYTIPETGETIGVYSYTFIGFFPSENPKYALSVSTPHAEATGTNVQYRAPDVASEIISHKY